MLAERKIAKLDQEHLTKFDISLLKCQLRKRPSIKKENQELLIYAEKEEVATGKEKH